VLLPHRELPLSISKMALLGHSSPWKSFPESSTATRLSPPSALLCSTRILTGKSSYGPGQPHEGFWGAVGDRAFKTFTPSLFPGNVGYDKMAGAIKGRPDYFGFPSSLGETLFSQSTGLNLRHFDPATEERFRNKEFRDAAEEIRKGMYSAAADQRLSQEERENRLNELSNRMDRLVRKYSSLGGEGPVAQSGTAIAPARKSTGSDWVDQMLK